MQRKWFCVVLVFFLAACSNQEEARRIPLNDFFKYPALLTVKLSPNGKFISFLQPYKNRMNLYVRAINSNKALRLTNEVDYNVKFHCWVNEDKLLYTRDIEPRGLSRFYSVSRTRKGSNRILFSDSAIVRFIDNKVVDNHLLISLNKRDPAIFDAYRLNAHSGKLVLAGKNPGNITKWFSDDFGALRMAVAGDGVNETLLYRESENLPFREVITNNFKTKITPVGYGRPGSNRIYALSNLNRDKAALVEFDCSTGKETKVIITHPEVDIYEGGYSPYRHKLLYGSYEIGRKSRVYLSDSVKAIYAYLEKLLPNREVRVIDKDSLESQWILRTFTERSQGAFYRYVISTKQLVKVGDLTPSFPEEELSLMKSVSYKSRDGLTIHGFLTLPKGSDGKKLPIIVFPHKDPFIRDLWGYEALVQLLANRGYGVFQVNYRGSLGYGKQFWTAAFKQWGGNVQHDIADGVRWLISEGIADKDRIGIYGEGFGGYCALYAMTFYPELYKCGASYSGFHNLFSYIKAVPPDYKAVVKMYYEIVGDPEKESDQLRAASPVFHANRVKNPLLIAQDINDERVNISETDQFVRALRKQNVPVTYISKEESEINFRNPENRMRFYQQLEEFFESNLKK